MRARSKSGRVHRIGVVSDTHGLVRPGLLQALTGVEMILHAGDVGGPEVLEVLQTHAPVVAVRGNMDGGSWARGLRQAEVVEIDGSLLYVLHDANEIDLDPAAAGFRAVISGHSHRPSQDRRNGVLFLNPGSAGPRRFRLPVSAAVLYVEGESLEAELIELED
jgi:putative phosphoesterase